MKKFTIIGIMIFALGATAFARGHQNNMHSGSTYCGSGVNQTGFKRSPEMEKSSILIGEKKLEIRKEMLKDSPDWNKIEKLNTEISTERGKMRTAGMKARFEYNKTLPNQN